MLDRQEEQLVVRYELNRRTYLGLRSCASFGSFGRISADDLFFPMLLLCTNCASGWNLQISLQLDKHTPSQNSPPCQWPSPHTSRLA